MIPELSPERVTESRQGEIAKPRVWWVRLSAPGIRTP